MTTKRTASSDQGPAGGESPPIDVREAVRAAYDFMQGLYKDTTLPNLMLEEVELSDDEKVWLVTYGYTASEQDVEANPFAAALGGTRTTRPRREYKVIQIDAHTGRPVSMKIRKV
ncbi:MAG TPA: hypothetical protein VFW96_17090 [Thermomicrobiales bacterium]|nr:hypothetical protein [Thermomicrobiales bacterium]